MQWRRRMDLSPSALGRALAAAAYHPLTLYVARYCCLAAAAGLIALALRALAGWIDLSLALMCYLPLVLVAGLWCDLTEVFLVLGTAAVLADAVFNSPPGQLWPIARPADRLAFLTFILVGFGSALLAQRGRRKYQRAALADAAIEANRLRLEFIAALAQEISAPVRTLDQHTQDLLIDDSEAPRYRRDASLQMVVAQAHRLRAILDNLIQTARIGDSGIELARRRVVLGELVKKVTEDFRAFVPDHPCRVLIEAGELAVYGDAARLRQVLANVLDNAARFSVSGSPVAVTLAVHDGEALIGVTDQGIGMLAAERERVFDRYAGGGVLTRVVGGSGPGLGLALCRGIVEAHGGRIWLDGAAGDGITVRIALPLYGGDGLALVDR